MIDPALETMLDEARADLDREFCDAIKAMVTDIHPRGAHPDVLAATTREVLAQVRPFWLKAYASLDAMRARAAGHIH